ncbi:hypothetical protein N7G274_007560 [Stereocaulon virgatum]|uniref:Uncharacterized protein n=1 Tax=Stereocaulon virgatum TaxID=373712 RepID=A0ABR4A314_9LECA
MRSFNLCHCFLLFQLAALALTVPTPIRSFDLTTAPISLSNPDPELNVTFPPSLTLTSLLNITYPVNPILPDLINNPPDPYYYQPSGYTLAVIFSEYRSTLHSQYVVSAAEQGWVEAATTHHGAMAPVGTATKLYTFGNAQLVIRPNAKMTWAMFQQACLWIMEVYHRGLISESILGFLDNAHEGNVGTGEVRLTS